MAGPEWRSSFSSTCARDSSRVTGAVGRAVSGVTGGRVAPVLGDAVSGSAASRILASAAGGVSFAAWECVAAESTGRGTVGFGVAGIVAESTGAGTTASGAAGALAGLVGVFGRMPVDAGADKGDDAPDTTEGGLAESVGGEADESEGRALGAGIC